MDLDEYVVTFQEIIRKNRPSLIEEKWTRNGIADRPFDQPAQIQRIKGTNIIVLERYFIDGQLSRDRQPAEIRYFENTGNVFSVGYYYQDMKSNLAAPAYI